MNLRDVARLSGVSRSTVSRVITGDQRVSGETRRRVLKVIREHDFHPNASAQSLASRRTRILGLFVPSEVGYVFGDPYFPKLIEGAVEECNAVDHNLMMLMDQSKDPESVRRMYDRVVGSQHLDGVVVASSVVDEPFVARLHESGFPFVLVGRHPYLRDISFVDIDNRGAAREAVSHLIGLGYRRVGMIGGPRNMIHASDRHDGYRAAMLEAGLTPDLVRYADFTEEGGYVAMKAMLSRKPEAVFSASDLMAFGSLRALREAGRRVPEDVAVMGFDGLEDGTRAWPSLSTVAQPVRDLGREAVKILLRTIAHPEERPSSKLLRTRLVIRRSCGGSREGAMPESEGGAVGPGGRSTGVRTEG